MIEFNAREKKILQSIGNAGRGDQFVEILERIKREISSIDDIDGQKDYGAQVEGRKLFKDAMGTLIDAIKSKERVERTDLVDDEYE